jgi:cystathionine beta-lyase/cystathionine gamma-synthase
MEFVDNHRHFSHDKMKEALPAIVASLPAEWRGTTFKNSKLLGREKFSTRVADLVIAKGANITTQDLVDLGNAEDYLRVSSNISSMLEVVLATERDMDISQVFTFASNHMPIIAVLLTSSIPVHIYVGAENSSPFSQEQRAILNLINCSFEIHESSPTQVHNDYVVLSTSDDGFSSSFVDGVVLDNVLYIKNMSKIVSSRVLTTRKRMATPITTPAALARLQALAGVPITSDVETATAAGVAEFYAHLQSMSGAPVRPANHPVVFTAGLPAICSMWVSLMSRGGADVVMASTAYGGSSELTDILHARNAGLVKHTFDITGKNNISMAIQTALDQLSSNPSALMPTTILFVEVPTNPDMKVPDIEHLTGMLRDYKALTSKEVILFVDTTFAPASGALDKIYSVDPTLTSMVFISMSKSVSRGLTTAGTIVAGPSEASESLLRQVAFVSTVFDTTARPDQLRILSENHTGVEARCQDAYNVAVQVGQVLKQAVKNCCNGAEMDLNFVTPAHASAGFTSSTYSFNLPPVGTVQENLDLAQKFVDLLTVHPEFKPCVSFGQDNGLVYATVPATSTQGAIKEEDKAKQAVGGVQLTRLSFPPACDVEAVCRIVADSVVACYQK